VKKQPSKTAAASAAEVRTAPGPVLDVATRVARAAYERTPARIIERKAVVSAEEKSAKERAQGGRYRVIHGNVSIAVPLSDRLFPNGALNEHIPAQILVHPGDIIELDDIDAASMLDHGLIEPLTARPSREGKVWDEKTRQNEPWDFKKALAWREAAATAAATVRP
jgi:hypothetical protein